MGAGLNAALLPRANAIRFAQADTKRELRAMPRTEACRFASRLLHDPPPHVQRMRVGTFLRSLPYVGTYRAEGILRAAGLHDPHVAIGPEHPYRAKALNSMQRQRLATVLREVA